MNDSLRIMVVDDDCVMRELLEAVLGLAGHTVTVVDSGEAALERLRSGAEPLDVVLTDLKLPGIEKKQLVSRLLEVRNPGTLLIGMSGSLPSSDELGLLDWFLQKPFTLEQFAAALENARAHQKASAETVAANAVRPGHAVLDEKVFSTLLATLPAAQLQELYALTLADVRTRVDRMQASLAAGNLEDVRRDAHAIKGGCGMVGASELYWLAATTEGGISAGSIPLADFPPACERLQRMLDERLVPRS